jgi:hypothetical protein
MIKDEIRNKINQIWESMFAIQKEACKGKLCLVDELRFKDLNEQLKALIKE